MTLTAFNDLQLPKKFIVGVDGRGMSDHAVRAAVTVGEQLGVSLELLHAVRVPILEWMGSDPSKGPAAIGRALAAAEPAVNEHVQRVLASSQRVLGSSSSSSSSSSPSSFSASPSSPSLSPSSSSSSSSSGTPDLRVRVLPGTPSEVLLSAARESDSAMIFLGQHEKRGLIDFGSTARTVLAKGTVPVWIQVRPERPVKRILAAIDLSDDSLRALSFACRLAGPLGATIRAVHIFDVRALFAAVTPDPLGYSPAISVLEVRAKVSEDFERGMASFDWRGIDHSAEVRDGQAAEGILELAESSDLVVIGTHGRTGLAPSVLGGVAHTVLKQSEAPVLAVPFPSRRFRI